MAPDDVRTLLDRAEIGDVILRYAQALDRRDFERLRDCFTLDAQATYSGKQLEPGVEHIIAHVGGLTSTKATTHFMGPSLIELDRADATSAHGGEGAADGVGADGVGADVLTPAIVYINTVEAGIDTVRTRGLRYQDRFVRQGGRWLISRRVHTVDWMYESPARPTLIAPRSEE